MDLKKPHSPKQVGGAERQSCAKRHRDMGWVVPHPHVVDKIWEGYLRARDPSPRFQHQEDTSA